MMNTESDVYLATALGVSIIFAKGQDIQWWIDMALAKGGVITCERIA